MNLSRRSFLGGVMALTASTALPIRGAFALALPTIWGDGVHDDAPGLNALLQGLPFHVENDDVVAADGVIRGGSFIIGEPIRITVSDFLVAECRFLTTPNFDGPMMIDLTDCRRGTFVSNVLTSYEYAQRPPIGGFSLADYENEKWKDK